ncbi:RBR-type E3 ubiquitin transferase [Aphelenchoides fujianensis]|nr:RBR-type E3 ubiquitin transferase [Aphelenchoides fujianensis]
MRTRLPSTPLEGMAMQRDQELSMEVSDYKMLNQEEVLSELNQMANETSVVLGFSPAICKILLHNFHWNKEFLIEKFYETGDKDRFLREYQSNARLKFCPGLDCGRVCQVPHPECREITCDCHMTFCFACGQHWHEPVDCQMLKMWLKKCSDDSETSNWLNANTKDCPQCHVTIEKDGGCNHVSCKNASCRFEFCWTCLGPWKPHGSGWYSCNRFDDTDAKKARDEQERSRAALQRYLHFFTRYEEPPELYAQVQEKMVLMQQQDYSWIETQYLKKAVDILNQCRQTLMYTYAFAFYLEANNTTSIFEDNQRDLELATEHLSELLERELDVEREKLKVWKQNVQDKSRYVQQRRVVLLSHVEEGAEEQRFK